MSEFYIFQRRVLHKQQSHLGDGSRVHYSINCCGKPIFVTKEEVDAQLEKFGKCAVKCAACRNVWYFDQSRDKFTKERDEAFRGAKPPITPKSSGKKVPLAPAEKINWGKIVSIQVDHGQVQEMAYALSQSGKSHDDLVWLYAEAELRLKPAYIVGNSNKDDDDEKTVELDSNVIVA